jgi:heptosyltransferase-3
VVSLRRFRVVKILLVKLGHLGDTLLLTPTLRFLKQKFPDAQLDVMVRSGCEVLLRGNPDVAEILPVGSPEKHNRSLTKELCESSHAFARIALSSRYDFAFDLSNSDRAKFWAALSRARVRGINQMPPVTGWRARLFTDFTHFNWGKEHQVLRDFRTVADLVEPSAQPGPLRFHPQAEASELRAKLPWLDTLGEFAVVHATSRWAFKEWLPERWAAVADALKRRGFNVVFSCGPGERELALVKVIQAQAKETHFSTEGKISLHELGWLLDRARLFLGVDTVAMHLAAAMQAPTVALFGPSSEWSWRPWQCPHELVLGECACKRTREFVCDKSKPYPCMERITVAEALAKAEALLNQPRAVAR